MIDFTSTRVLFFPLVVALLLLLPQEALAQSLGGLKFDGVDDYVLLDSELTDQLSGQQQLSFEVRVTFNELKSNGGILSFRTTNGNSNSKVLELRTSDRGGEYFVIDISSGQENSQTATSTPLQVDREYLVSMVFDGSQRTATNRTRLYIDGVRQTLTGGSKTPKKSPKINGNAPVYLGRSQNTYSAVTIQELRIWDEARSETGVMDNVANGLAAPYAGVLTAYYDFNVPSASNQNDLADRQTGAFTGELINFDVGGTESGWVQAFSLPVELTSFLVTPRTSHNLLQWTVASERDFSHYSVERSLTGTSGWTEIDRVYASGSTEGAAKQYGTLDATPAAAAYYRLRMVDLDGTFEYSDVVLQEREVAADVTLSVYPNPTSGPVTLELATDEAVSVALTDVSGRRVWQRELSAGAANRASLNPELAPGVYMLTAHSGSNTWTKRLVVR